MFKELNILRPFFEDPKREYNIRELSRILKISPATVSKDLKNISKKGILKEKKERNFIFYKANLSDDRYKDLKTYYNIRKIKESGLIDELNIYYHKPTIILYGSFTTGLDTKDSDIDLVIISENTKDFPKKSQFEKKLHKTLQIFIVNSIKEIKNEHLVNSILNGIVLQGSLRWI